MSDSKDALALEERIEKIRRRNEEIKRRHLEVEADKQHAAKLNALVEPRARTEDWTSGWSPLATEHKRSEREVPDSRQNISRAGRRCETDNAESQKLSKQNGKCYVFTQEAGPPPDPVYNFLADTEREPVGERLGGRHASRSGGARLPASRQRGRDRAQPHKEARHNNHHAEYEAWRAERNRIDQDRINRQKTADGLWRREWDNEKVPQDFQEEPVFRAQAGRQQPQGRIGSGRFSSSQVEHDGDVQKTTARTPSPCKRNICTIDGTLTVSITNNACPTSKPLQRVRVKPPAMVGSGRVGPRQKARTSYSSQSEDEQLSPQRLIRTIDNTLPTPSQNIVQTVRFNSASLRPPLPPTSSQESSGPRKQRDDSAKSRQSRKRNMHGDYSKREERRTDSTSSSLGNDSEGAGDESWEDVTTSGAESACETSEDKLRRSMNKAQSDVGRGVESQTSGNSRPVNGEGRKTISNEQEQSWRADKLR